MLVSVDPLGLLDCVVVILQLIFENLHAGFPSGCILHLRFPPTAHKNPNFSASLPALVVVCFVCVSGCPGGCEAVICLWSFFFFFLIY